MFSYYPRWSRASGDYRRGRVYQTSILPFYARSRLLIEGAGLTESWSDFGVIQNPINTAEYGGGIYFLEVNMKTDNASFPARARVYNVTDSEAVVGSIIQTFSTSSDRVRSEPLSLSGDKTYKIQLGHRTLIV